MSNRRQPFTPGILWSILAAYIGLIFYLSSRPNSDLLGDVRLSDKVLHAGEYGVLGFLSQRAAHLSWPGAGRGATIRRSALVFLCGAALAGLDELLQSRVPTRTACVSDLAADWAGLGIGLVLNVTAFRSGGLEDAARGGSR